MARRRSRGSHRGKAGQEGPVRSDPARSAVVWDELGGYRLLRVIGRGDHSDAYLGTGEGEQVVVKAYHEDADRQRIGNEVGALASIRSPHVVRLIDTSLTPDRPTCLVLERLSGSTLADWLRSREVLETGEVITASVSTLRAVRAVHAAGWVHGNVSTTSIRFDDAGRPVLLSFGHASAATPAGLAADWSRCANVVDAILARAETLEPDELRTVAAVLSLLGERYENEESLVDEAELALFALGPPSPLAMRPAEGGALTRPPVRSPTDAVWSSTRGEDDQTPRESDRPPHPSGARFLKAAAIAMERGVGGQIAQRVRVLISGRRRAVTVGVAAAVVLTVVALMAMPSAPAGHAEATAPATSTALATPTTASTSGATRSVRAGSPRSTEAPGASAASKAEDPVTAAFHLLKERSECLADGDVACLAAVEQAGSPLLTADGALIAAGGKPAPPPVLARLSLAETIGDAAVIAIAPETNVPDAATTDDAAGNSQSPGTTKPASVLLIKTEAGWRLRALYES